MVKRILIIPPHPHWYVERYVEYIIRYLSDEFFFEIATVPYPPYETYLDRYPNESPFMRNPDKYDLIWPLLPTHWFIPQEIYAHKVVTAFYSPNEGYHVGVAGIGATTPMVEESLKYEGKPFTSLRFGIDTNFFVPASNNRVREDNLLHVGYIGTHINPRHMVKDAVMPIADIPGVRLMIYPTTWVNNGGDLNQVGGDKFLRHVVTGDQTFPGLINIYQNLDVVVRMDQDPAYSFPVEESAACGVPFITTNCGIDKLFTDKGCGMLIDGDRNYYMNNAPEVGKKVVEAVTWLRDHPEERKKMGRKGRQYIEEEWTWDKFIPSWREFFRKGLERAAV